MSGAFAVAWWQYLAAGWAPIPVAYADGSKQPAVAGVTGRAGSDLTEAQCVELAARLPDAHLGVRMPAGVLGVDVDDYGSKRGGATLAEAVRRWGPLPAGPWSSARDDGVSGIRFYRVPTDLEFVGVIRFGELGLADIELIARHHRFAVAAPSVHIKIGAPYTWRGVTDVVPNVAELPELPAAWVEGLRRTARSGGTSRSGRTARSGGTSGPVARVGSVEVSAWLDGLPDGECPRVRKIVDGVVLDVGSRYDSTKDAVWDLVREGHHRHRGVRDAVAKLRADYVAEVPERDAEVEFERQLSGAVAKVGDDPPPSDGRGCCNPLEQFAIESLQRRQEATARLETPLSMTPQPTVSQSRFTTDTGAATMSTEPPSLSVVPDPPTTTTAPAPMVGQLPDPLNLPDGWASMFASRLPPEFFTQPKPAPKPWALRGLLRVGDLGALVGGAGSGKSLYAYGLALDAGRAGLSAVYLDAENGHDDILTRTHDYGFRRGVPPTLHYFSFPSVTLDTEAGALEFRRWADQMLASVGRIDVVVLDTASRFLDGDENESAPWLNMYRRAFLPLKRAGIAVLRLDHTGKDEAKGARGSSAKNGDVDVVVQMAVTSDKGADKRASGGADERVAVTVFEVTKQRSGNYPARSTLVRSTVDGLLGYRAATAEAATLDAFFADATDEVRTIVEVLRERDPEAKLGYRVAREKLGHLAAQDATEKAWRTALRLHKRAVEGLPDELPGMLADGVVATPEQANEVRRRSGQKEDQQSPQQKDLSPADSQQTGERCGAAAPHLTAPATNAAEPHVKNGFTAAPHLTAPPSSAPPHRTPPIPRGMGVRGARLTAPSEPPSDKSGKAGSEPVAPPPSDRSAPQPFPPFAPPIRPTASASASQTWAWAPPPPIRPTCPHSPPCPPYTCDQPGRSA